MTAIEVGEMVGYLMGAFVLGWSAGYLMTKFRDAVNQIG